MCSSESSCGSTPTDAPAIRTQCRRAIRSWASPDGTRSTHTGSGTPTASRSIAKSNSLAIGDVGQDTEEELDYTKIQRASGANFGWPKWEGDLLFDPNRPDPNLNPPFPVFPILTYTHSSGCAIIGGYVVHDRGLPSLRGRYLYTDLCGGVIRSVVPRPGSATGNQSTGLHLSVPGSFGEGPTGRIYVASQNGPVYRIKQAP